MKELVVVLTLMGCDDAGTQCEFIQSPDAHWTSLRACDEAGQALLMRVKADYSSTVAQCEVLDAGAIALASDTVPADRPARDVTDETAIAVTISPPTRRGTVRRWVTVRVQTVADKPARIAGFARDTTDRVTALLPAW